MLKSNIENTVSSSLIKKILVLLSIGVILLILSLYNRSPKSNTVTLTEDGFSPKILKIKLGDTVTFRTNRGRSFWPASDPHPIHTDYEGFDPGSPITASESWKFTFMKPGEWNYHDHLSPYFTGKIIVGAAGQSQCDPKKDERKCIEKNIIYSLQSNGLEKTFDLVADLYGSNEIFASSCHEIAHNIGIASYKLYEKDKDSVISAKSAYCANGFYHGFMEAFLGVNGDPIKARDLCHYFGLKLKDAAPDASMSCFHGIGHGAIEVTIKRIPSYTEDSLIAPALELCKKASTNDEELYRCASGIFNGIANFYINKQFGLKYDPLNPLRLCDQQIGQIYKESCYGNMNAFINWLSGNDFSLSAKIVESISDNKYAIPTIRYTAAIAANGALKDPTKNITICRTIRDPLHDACIEGFAHGLLENGPPGIEYEGSIAFCSIDKLTKSEKDVCLSYAFNLRGWYPMSKIKEICREYPQFEKYCQKNLEQ